MGAVARGWVDRGRGHRLRPLFGAAAALLLVLVLTPPPDAAALPWTTRFRGGTFNIGASTGNGALDWQARLDRSVRVIKGGLYPKDGPSGRALDIVALQEVRRNQYDYMMLPDKLGGAYDVFPASFVGASEGYAAINPVIWRRAEFQLVEGSLLWPPSLQGVPALLVKALPLVLLQHRTTGQMVYVLNVHDPAQAQYAQIRLDNAALYRDLASLLATESWGRWGQDAVIGVWGDFNSGYRVDKLVSRTVGDDPALLAHCVIASGSTLRDAFLGALGLTEPCPAYPGTNYIDHLLTSGAAVVEGFGTAPRGPLLNGSDVHPTVMADYLVRPVAPPLPR